MNFIKKTIYEHDVKKLTLTIESLEEQLDVLKYNLRVREAQLAEG